MGSERTEGEVVERLTQQTCTFPAHIDRDGIGWSKFRMADVQFVLGELERLSSLLAEKDARIGELEAFVRGDLQANFVEQGARVSAASEWKSRALAAEARLLALDREETGSSQDHAPTTGFALDGAAEWLRDMAVAYRGDAEGIVGGMRNRMIQDAIDCERWADEIDRLSSAQRKPECATCGGSRRIHVVEGCTTPAHDRDCPVCVGWPLALSSAKQVPGDSSRDEPIPTAGDAQRKSEWVLVPREPGETTLDAAIELMLGVRLGGDYKWRDYARDLYRAMIAAAPPPPEAGEA